MIKKQKMLMNKILKSGNGIKIGVLKELQLGNGVVIVELGQCLLYLMFNQSHYSFHQKKKPKSL